MEDPGHAGVERRGLSGPVSLLAVFSIYLVQDTRNLEIGGDRLDFV